MFQTTNQEVQMMLVIGDHQPEFVREKTWKNIIDTTKQKSFSPSWFPEFLHGRLPPQTKLAPFSLAEKTLGSIGVRWSQPALNAFEGPKIHQNPFYLENVSQHNRYLEKIHQNPLSIKPSQKRKHDRQRDLATDFKKRPPASSYLRWQSNVCWWSWSVEHHINLW